MAAVLKRYVWIGTAALTVVMAYFVAGGIGQMILSSVGKGVDLSQAPPGSIDDDAGAAMGFASTERVLRLDDLLAGNLFDLPPDDYDAGDEEIGPEEPVDAGPPEDLGGGAQTVITPCPLALQVQALVAGSDARPELGFATIIRDGLTAEYRVGYDIGGHRVSRITWNRVYIEQAGSGNECFLDIRYPNLASAAGVVEQPPPPMVDVKPPEQPPPPPAEGGSREDRFRQAVEASIETVSDTDRTVQRSLINTILDNQDIAMRQARVMPHEEGGEVIGFKVYGIRRDSLFGKLGLENGDLVQSINGIPMTGADKALQAYGRLRMADRISITVTRRGESITLNYNIR